MQILSIRKHFLLLASLQVIVITAIGVAAYSYGRSHQDTLDGQACTLDVKICSDGSAVGRTGPNCEFPDCPPEPTPATSVVLPPTAYALTPEYHIILPTGATHDREWIRLGTDTYFLLVNQDGGLCPFNAPTSECSYTDTPTVRLWRDREGIFALNFMPEPIGTESVPSVIVERSDKKKFSKSEISLWEEIMRTLTSSPTQSSD